MLLATMELSSALPLTIFIRQRPAGQTTIGAHPAAGRRQYWTVLGKVSGTEEPVFTIRNPRLKSATPVLISGRAVIDGPEASVAVTVKTVSAGWLLSPELIILTASPTLKKPTSLARTVNVTGEPVVTDAVRSASILAATPEAEEVLMRTVSEPPGPVLSPAAPTGFPPPTVRANQAILMSFVRPSVAILRFCCTSTTAASMWVMCSRT